MGKRKRSKSKESDYQNVLRKIRKLETKLRKCRRSSSPVSDSDNSHYVPYYNTQEYEDLSDEQLSDKITDTYEGQPESAEPVAEPSTLPAEPVAAPSTSLVAPAPVPPLPPALSTDNGDDAQKKPLAEDNVPLLDPDLLELLGEDPTNQKAYGESLHKDIASRWTHILANGLSKDTQSELLKTYLIPENCPTMKAPKLNLEIKAALLEINVKKDLYNQSKQNQLASSLAAMGRALNWALSTKNIVPPDIIKSLSDAGRLICDNHHKESQSRRYAALSTLDRNIRDTVKNTNIDENLFGSALSDHIKSSKAITRTGSEIKQKAQRPAYRFPAASQIRGALNSRGAPRVASTVEPRPTPAPRRPPRDRRQEAPRGRRPTNHARHQTRRR